MSQRYQREIEEILDQVNVETPVDEVGTQRRRQRAQRTKRAPGQGFRFTTGRLMLAGIGLLFASLLLVGIYPPLAAPAAWFGIILFIGAYVAFFSRPRRGGTEKRWRGESLEEPQSGSGLRRFWDWLTRG